MLKQSRPRTEFATMIDEQPAATLLDAVVEASSVQVQDRGPAAGLLLGECLRAEPSAEGRVLVRWTNANGTVVERWLPTLRHVTAREADRVILIDPPGSPMQIVAGVINDFTRTPESDRAAPQTVTLRPNEALLVTDHEGQPLVEFSRSERGVMIRPVASDVDFAVPGAFTLRAGQISLQSEKGHLSIHGHEGLAITTDGDALIRAAGDMDSQARVQSITADLGNVNVRANDDIRLNGERIKLNS